MWVRSHEKPDKTFRGKMSASLRRLQEINAVIKILLLKFLS